MLTIGVLFLIPMVALLALAARQRNLETPFIYLSLLPTPLFVVTYIGLLHNGNSVPFYVGFCISLLLSLLAAVWGAVLIVMQKKDAAKGKLFLLVAFSSVPLLFVVLKTVYGLAVHGME